MMRGSEVEVTQVSEKSEVTSKSEKPHLHILGIQSTIAWENPEANRLHFEKLRNNTVIIIAVNCLNY